MTDTIKLSVEFPKFLVEELWPDTTQASAEMKEAVVIHLLVPEAVFQEVVVAGREQPGSSQTDTARQEGWLTVMPLRDPARASSWLRRGLSATDAAVVALAQEHPQHQLLTDDLAVRTAAQEAGLQVIGTIGLLIEGRRDGHLTNLRQTLDQLITSGFYLDLRGPLYQKALQLAGES